MTCYQFLFKIPYLSESKCSDKKEAHKDGEEGAPQESSTCNLFCLFASVNAVVMKY